MLKLSWSRYMLNTIHCMERAWAAASPAPCAMPAGNSYCSCSSLRCCAVDPTRAHEQRPLISSPRNPIHKTERPETGTRWNLQEGKGWRQTRDVSERLAWTACENLLVHLARTWTRGQNRDTCCRYSQHSTRRTCYVSCPCLSGEVKLSHIRSHLPRRTIFPGC